MATSMTGATGSSLMGNGTGGLSGSGISGNKVPRGYKEGQIQQFTPEQMQLSQQMFAHAAPNSYTSRLAAGDQGIFNEIEAPAMQQFNALQGSLASRFSGMGMGGRSSSAFKNASSQASQDFAQQLQSQRQGLQRQALGDIRGISQELLGQRPYEQFLTQKQRPWWQNFLLNVNDKGQQLAMGAANAAVAGAM